jgi:hypothetical protein
VLPSKISLFVVRDTERNFPSLLSIAVQEVRCIRRWLHQNAGDVCGWCIPSIQIHHWCLVCMLLRCIELQPHSC